MAAAQPDWLETDFYKILGVDTTATDEEIRSAYRKLTRTAHPDANPDNPDAEERFKAITAAYNILGDREKRSEYDQLRRRATVSAGLGGTRSGDGRMRVTVNDAGDLGGLGSLFGQYFDGPGFGPNPTHGATRDGDSAAPVRSRIACPTFRGSGRIRRPRKVKVRVPAGVDDGQTIRLPGQGEPGYGSGPPGDVYVTVDVDPHPRFGRVGNNLTLTVPVTYPEAALGADVTIPTLDGDKVTVRVPPGTPPGRVLRVPGRGVPKANNQGDLLLTIDLDVPTNPSSVERDLIEQLAAASTTRPRTQWETTP